MISTSFLESASNKFSLLHGSLFAIKRSQVDLMGEGGTMLKDILISNATGKDEEELKSQGKKGTLGAEEGY